MASSRLNAMSIGLCGQLLLTGVAVEKPPLLKKLPLLRDRKCPPKSRTSFIGHPSAMKFLRTSRA